METTGMAKSASNPRIPVCVRFIPLAFEPPCPPMTASALALCAARRKSPKSAKIRSKLFFGVPLETTSTILPLSRERSLVSCSRSSKFTGTISPSTPLAGVEPVQPMASTCSLWRVGESNSASAVPRFQPRHSCHFSACTFSSPMPRILAMPQSTAFCASGVPVTRAPTLSLSSVKYSNACEFIIPSPAIFVSAGLVPSSSGPLNRSSPSAICAAPRSPHPSTAVPTLASHFRIRSSPRRRSAHHRLSRQTPHPAQVSVRQAASPSFVAQPILAVRLLWSAAVLFTLFTPSFEGSREGPALLRCKPRNPTSSSLRPSAPSASLRYPYLSSLRRCFFPETNTPIPALPNFRSALNSQRGPSASFSVHAIRLCTTFALRFACVSRALPGKPPPAPRTDRATRNPRALRVQRRQPQGSPHPRTHQQRTRRPPVRPPFLRLQPLLPTNRIPARTHHPRRRRYRRHPPLRHLRPAQPRRNQRPRLSGRPCKIRPHPEPSTQRPPRISRSHHNLPPPPSPRLLARPHLRPLRRRLPRNLRTRPSRLQPGRNQNQSCQACQFDRKIGPRRLRPQHLSLGQRQIQQLQSVSSFRWPGCGTYDVSRLGHPVRSDWETPGTVTRDCEIRVS